MTGIAAVRGWPLDQLGAVVLALEAGADELLGAAGAVQNSVAGAVDWTGATHDAVTRRVTTQSATTRRTAHTVEAAAAAGRQAWEEMVPARTLLLQLVDTARGAGFTVADDGGVTHPSSSRTADAGYLATRIRSLLSTLRDLDGTFGLRLTQLAGLLARDGESIPHPLGGWASPRQVIATLQALPQDARRDFWDTLSPNERQVLIDADPQVIGNLDGVAFTDRITANRISIRRALAYETAMLNTLLADPGRVADLKELLAPAPGPDGRLGPRQFIAFDNSGNGRYIEQIGALTPQSPGVGVFVPGTGANLGNSEAQRRRALDLARSSGAPVFVFADGDLPQKVAPKLTLDPRDALTDSAADPGPARRLAQKLVTFGRDLDHEVAAATPGTPVTYLGHSYGGSVVGTAEQYGLRADNVVYASSAGTGVGDGPWRNANPDVHRYSMTPPGDPIHYAQKLGGMVHGGDPDTAPGVHRMDSGFYSTDGARHGRLVFGTDAHAAYLDDPGSTAFGNLAAVLAGREPTPYLGRAPDMPAAAAVEQTLHGPLPGLIGFTLKLSLKSLLHLP
ncbi:alpha/beta hydrolase [Gordonia alkaliphila]|uniref:Alpha/beta hydrolase n=1 Tax=Gordonia alkaliphila TaxID=1053547 RepID=A0ABP8YVU9_9ACTN